MNNAKTLELRTLGDEELVEVVGGWNNGCQPEKCEPCGGGLDVDVDIRIDVDICV